MSKKGLPFIGKLNDFIEKVLHPTVQKVGPSKAALDVVSRGYYCVNGTSTPLTVEAGSTDNILKKTGHSIKVGDMIRILTSANGIQENEISVDSIVDADNVLLAGYLSANLAAGDTFHVLRPTVELLDISGASLASVVSPPVQYNRKAGGVTASTTVLEDLDTPANSRALPVVLHGVDAASITITSNDLNIASSHVNDSIRLGDGTTLVNATLSNELKVNDAGLNTKMTDGTQKTQITDGGGVVNTRQLSSPIVATDIGLVTNSIIHGITTGGGGGYVDVKVNPSGALTTEATLSASVGTRIGTVAIDQTTPGTTNLVQVSPLTNSSIVKAQLQDNAGAAITLGQQLAAASIPVILPAATISTLTPPAAITGFALETTQLTGNTSLSNIDTAVGAKADAVATTDTGTFSLIALIKKVAQNITAMSAKLPAALGITTAANSLSIAPASDAVFTNKPKAITTTYAENLALTTVTTITAPANAIGVLVMADDTNSNNIRIKQNATASLTSGIPLQAGRDIKLDAGSDLSVISDNAGSAGASVKVYFQWYIQA